MELSIVQKSRDLDRTAFLSTDLGKEERWGTQLCSAALMPVSIIITSKCSRLSLCFSAEVDFSRKKQARNSS